MSIGSRGPSLGCVWCGLLLVLITACGTITTGFSVFEKEGVRMTLEALPYRGVAPFVTQLVVRLDLAPEIYHKFKGCFLIHFDFFDGTEAAMESQCEAYEPEREPDREGRIRMEFFEEHTFYNVGKFEILVTVRAARMEDRPIIIRGKVPVQVVAQRGNIPPG